MIFMFSHSSIADWVVSLLSSFRLRDFENLFLELLRMIVLVFWERSSLLFYLLFRDLLKLEMAERELMVLMWGLTDLVVLSLRDRRLAGLASVLVGYGLAGYVRSSFKDCFMLLTCTLMQFPRVLIMDSLLMVLVKMPGCSI